MSDFRFPDIHVPSCSSPDRLAGTLTPVAPLSLSPVDGPRVAASSALLDPVREKAGDPDASRPSLVPECYSLAATPATQALVERMSAVSCTDPFDDLDLSAFAPAPESKTTGGPPVGKQGRTREDATGQAGTCSTDRGSTKRARKTKRVPRMRVRGGSDLAVFLPKTAREAALRDRRICELLLPHGIGVDRAVTVIGCGQRRMRMAHCDEFLGAEPESTPPAVELAVLESFGAAQNRKVPIRDATKYALSLAAARKFQAAGIGTLKGEAQLDIAPAILSAIGNRAKAIRSSHSDLKVLQGKRREDARSTSSRIRFLAQVLIRICRASDASADLASAGIGASVREEKAGTSASLAAMGPSIHESPPVPDAWAEPAIAQGFDIGPIDPSIFDLSIEPSRFPVVDVEPFRWTPGLVADSAYSQTQPPATIHE